MHAAALSGVKLYKNILVYELVCARYLGFHVALACRCCCVVIMLRFATATTWLLVGFGVFPYFLVTLIYDTLH